MVKKIFIVLVAVILATRVSAQSVNEVTLIVSGDGTTKEEARLSALRDAIEQAYGTFVSANTSILDDEVIKDEIVTVSSGNIQKYTELGTMLLPNGNTSITLQATVSVSKLITYAQSKGSECEFAGETFATNLKLDKLNRENAEKAINQLIEQLQPLIPDMFEFQLKVEEPHLLPQLFAEGRGETVQINCRIYLKHSPKVKIIFETLLKTLDVISQHLAKNQRVPGSDPYCKITIAGAGGNCGLVLPAYAARGAIYTSRKYLLPSLSSLEKLYILLSREITGALSNWQIRDNLGATYEIKYNGCQAEYKHNYIDLRYQEQTELYIATNIGRLITTSTKR